MKFRKRPVVVEVVEWRGDNLREVIDFTGWHESASSKWTWEQYEEVVRTQGLKIFTLEGWHKATVGDFIIKGVHGEFYPCKPDIFAKTYESAGTAPGREEPKPIPFPVSNVMQAWVDYAKAIKSDYDALAAELERVTSPLVYADDRYLKPNEAGMGCNAKGWYENAVFWKQRATAAEAAVAQLREQYDELIMAVARKHQNETRHQTALRYIRQAEEPSSRDQYAAAPIARSRDE